MKGQRLLAQYPRNAAKVLAVVLAASLAFPARGQPYINPFFGFDFVLAPITVKWARGEETQADLAGIERLIEAFPEDAEHADLREILDETLASLARGDELEKLFGTALSQDQKTQVCEAALPLSVAWVTPEQLAGGHSDGAPAGQDAAWQEFYKALEALQ